MDARRSTLLTVAVATSYIAAVAAGVIAVLLTVGLVREYGPAEGYGNLLWQTLPIVLIGMLLAGLFTWTGRTLARRRVNVNGGGGVTRR